MYVNIIKHPYTSHKSYTSVHFYLTPKQNTWNLRPNQLRNCCSNQSAYQRCSGIKAVFFPNETPSEFEVFDHCQASCPKEPRGIWGLEKILHLGAKLKIWWEDLKGWVSTSFNTNRGFAENMWRNRWLFHIFPSIFPRKNTITQSWHDKVLKIQAPSMYLVELPLPTGKNPTSFIIFKIRKSAGNSPKVPICMRMFPKIRLPQNGWWK